VPREEVHRGINKQAKKQWLKNKKKLKVGTCCLLEAQACRTPWLSLHRRPNQTSILDPCVINQAPSIKLRCSQA
jgi:hypothetical protein